MATKVASLFAEIGLDDKLTGGLQRAENALDKIGNQAKNIGSAISKGLGAATKLTLPLTVGLGLGVKAASDFEGAMSEIQARTGASAKEMLKVKDAALAMGKSGKASASAAADAMLELLASGQNVNEAIASLPHVFTLSAAGAVDLGRAADGATDALAQFGLGVDDINHVVDTLVKGAQASSADVGDLLDSLANVGPIAKNFGMDIDEVVAALAVMAENGVKGAEAGTQFKSMLTQMNTKEAQNALKDLGVSLTDTAGNFRPLNDVLGDIKKAIEDLPESERAAVIQKIAGSYGQVALSALLGSVSIDTMNARMKDSADAAEVAEGMMNSFGNKLSALKNIAETAFMPVMGRLIDNTLKPMVSELGKTMENVGAWIDANPELADTMTRVLAVVAIGIPLLNIMAGALGAIGTLVSAGGALLTGLGALATALSPVLLALAGIAAVGGLAGLAIAGVGEAAAGVGRLIHGDPELKASEEARMLERQKYLPGNMNTLRDKYFDNIVGQRSMEDEFYVQGQLGRGGQAAMIAAGYHPMMPTSTVTALEEAGKKIGTSITTALAPGVEPSPALKTLTVPPDAGAWGSLIAAIGSIRIGIAGPVMGTEGSMIKGKRASGGPVSAGSAYLVGEEGAELFIPNRSGYIAPNKAGWGGPQVIQLQLDGKTIYEVVVNEERQRRNFREF